MITDFAVRFLKGKRFYIYLCVIQLSKMLQKQRGKYEMTYILFSPVGKTDPITNYHDGSLIHICRKYKPEKVYLYLSQEMLNFHRLDDRYCRCLEWLQKKEKFHAEIILLERPDLVDVQVFDYFYDEFEQEVQKIQQENPEATILFNVSSGHLQ